ncbi:unnamed protein product [Phaeothamnion confervicola]
MWVDVPEDAEPAPMEDGRPTTAVSANAFAVGSNQNAGNFLTDKPTTRVRAPPGGASTFSISGNSEPEATPRQRFPNQKPEVNAAAAAAAAAATAANGYVPVAVAANAQPVQRTSANAFATGSNQNAGNFLTDKPTTRVHAPPGGRTSICLG